VDVHAEGGQAESAYLELPQPLLELIASIGYTGKQRMHVHFGTAGGRIAYVYQVGSSGNRWLRVMNLSEIRTLFDRQIEELEDRQMSVNSSPHSPDYFTVEPDPYDGVLERALQERFPE
jgi:hypothetical protein